MQKQKVRLRLVFHFSISVEGTAEKVIEEKIQM